MTETLPKKPRRHGVLPGFGLTLGITLTYASIIVLIPLATLFLKAGTLTWAQFLEAAASPRTLASYRVTFLASFLAAATNAVFGFIVAWVLVRYRFPGRKVVDALVDLPFALPTAVSGIALAAVYSEDGWIGGILASAGIRVAFGFPGIYVCLVFIGLPFVVRTLQPALEELEAEVEEAAASLGASRLQSFRRVILPAVRPAILTGFALAFARALGEYGSVVFIAGNMPMKTEITALLVIIELEQYDYAGAAAIAVVCLLASFLLLFFINGLQWWVGRHRIGSEA